MPTAPTNDIVLISHRADPRSGMLYLDDTHIVAAHLDDCVAALIEAGISFAPSVGVAYVRTPYGSEVHAYHFFGLDGREVAHFLPAMARVVPALVILDTPRVWHEDFKDELSFQSIAGNIAYCLDR